MCFTIIFKNTNHHRTPPQNSVGTGTSTSKNRLSAKPLIGTPFHQQLKRAIAVREQQKLLQRAHDSAVSSTIVEDEMNSNFVNPIKMVGLVPNLFVEICIECTADKKSLLHCNNDLVLFFFTTT